MQKLTRKIMPNPMYIKGVRKERAIVNQEKACGNIAFRSAGSHSPIDVVVIDKEGGLIRLIQCKAGAMTDLEKRKIEKKNEGLKGIYEVTFEVI